MFSNLDDPCVLLVLVSCCVFGLRTCIIHTVTWSGLLDLCGLALPLAAPHVVLCVRLPPYVAHGRHVLPGDCTGRHYSVSRSSAHVIYFHSFAPAGRPARRVLITRPLCCVLPAGIGNLPFLTGQCFSPFPGPGPRLQVQVQVCNEDEIRGPAGPDTVKESWSPPAVTVGAETGAEEASASAEKHGRFPRLD